MHNGITLNQPGLMTRPMAMEALREPGKISIWGDALKFARGAHGWSVKDLINRAARDATPAKVAYWERGDERPTPRQCDLLRKFLPQIREFDHLLPPGHRGDPKASKVAAIEREEAPAGWRGPKVSTFGEALRFCREKDAISQIAQAHVIGVSQSTYNRYELGRQANGEPMKMIQEVYQRLVDQFPMLEFAPKPEFSGRFTNQIKTNNFIASQQAAGDAARRAKIAKDAIEAHVKEQVRSQQVDVAPVNAHGAHYGVLKAEVYTLQAKLVKMQAEYETAKTRIEAEIQTLKEQQKEADEAMMKAAIDAHGVET